MMVKEGTSDATTLFQPKLSFHNLQIPNPQRKVPGHLDTGPMNLFIPQGHMQGMQYSCKAPTYLKLQEFCDASIDIAPPLHSIHNAAEVVIHQQDVRGLLGNRCPRHHGKPNIGVTQCRRVIGAITSHRHNLCFIRPQGCTHNGLASATCWHLVDDLQGTWGP